MGVGSVSNVMLMRDVKTRVWTVHLQQVLAPMLLSLPSDDRDIAIERVDLWFTAAGSGGAEDTQGLVIAVGPAFTIDLVRTGIPTNSTDTAVGTIRELTMETDLNGITGEPGTLSFAKILPVGHKLRLSLSGPVPVPPHWEADLQLYWRYLDMNREAIRG